jgi:NAD(P)-dependent dehydrogenase (short-subunit alcohol dehydrogenase family)
MSTTTAQKMFGLDGKVALITGGCGGMGTALCRGLSALGASIGVADRDADRVAGQVAALQADGINAWGTWFDAMSAADTRRMVDEIAGHFGGLDILVNTVGGNTKAELADAVTEAGFGEVLALNLTTAMFQSQAAAKHMIAGGHGGKIVHVGSVRSLLALRGKGFSGYCAAKGGLAILCKQLAAEWAPHKINVNMISPTFIRTPQGESFLTDPVFKQGVIDRIPLGRIGETDDIVAAAAFLSSAASDFITGHNLFVDGGVTATQ